MGLNKEEWRDFWENGLSEDSCTKDEEELSLDGLPVASERRNFEPSSQINNQGSRHVNPSSVNKRQSKPKEKTTWQSIKDVFIETKEMSKKERTEERQRDLLKIKTAVYNEMEDLKLYFDMVNVDYVIKVLANDIISLYDKGLIASIEEYKNGFSFKSNKLGKPVFVTFNSFLFTRLVHYIKETDSIKYTDSYVYTYQKIREKILKSYVKRRECYYALLGTEEYVDSLTNEYVFACLRYNFPAESITEDVIDKRLELDRRKLLELQSHKKHYSELAEMALFISTIFTAFPPLAVAYVACNTYNKKNREDAVANELHMRSNIDPRNYNVKSSYLRK